MLFLTSTSDLITVVTSAIADVEVHASWVDNNAGTITPGRTNTASITSATTTTIVGSPGASTQRSVQGIIIHNNHATITTTIIVNHTDGTNVEQLIELAALLPGETLVMTSNNEWILYDASGGQKGHTGFAIREEVEGGSSVAGGGPSSLIKVISPGTTHYHPGCAKAWVKVGVAGGAGLAAYNISSVGDSGAGLATINFTTGFKNTSYTVVAQIERTVTTLAVSDLKYLNVRFDQQLIGSCNLEVYDGTATTSVQEDPTMYHAIFFGRFA